eukprot:Seg204.7 transcript_id=Seg204.7/GoldUCD/mRNA.D3Y31 product="Phosphatidylcholine transfer protein" protein_id=Seg204.7/GoldUCD/D3Y31
MFSEVQFADALREFKAPDLSEFEFFNESMNVTIHRKYNPDSGLYEYKVLGTLDCPAEICKQVYLDLEYRKTWDSHVGELCEMEVDGMKVIYWNVNYPFPMSNRDYSYIRECREFNENDKRTWVVLAKSHKTESIPVKRKIIRVEDFHQFMVIQEDSDNKTKAFMQYYDDPKGMIPTWLINWAAKTGIPGFLKSMKNACESYEEYLKGERN